MTEQQQYRTTDEDTERWHREQDARLTRMRALDPSGRPSLPTREQIAVTLHANGTSYTAEKWGDLPQRYRAMLTNQADAVLTLIQKDADR